MSIQEKDIILNNGVLNYVHKNDVGKKWPIIFSPDF
jgi:hypothetical protein